MKKLTIIFFVVLLHTGFLSYGQRPCTPTAFGACGSQQYSARLERMGSFNPDPSKVITNWGEVRPNTEYRIIVFNDNYPNGVVQACMSNMIGFTPRSSLGPFCTYCKDLGTHATFFIRTAATLPPTQGLVFTLGGLCSQDKSCGRLNCGSPYQYDFQSQAALVVP